MTTPASSRIGGFAALGFAATIFLAGGGMELAGLPVPGTEPAEVIAFFDEKSDLVRLTSVFVPIAWVLAMLFAAGAVAALRRSERDGGEAWSLVGFAGLTLQNAAMAGVIAIRLALAATAPQDGAAIAGLWSLHDALFTLNGTFLATALLGLSIGGRRANLIRPWHGTLGLLSAVLLFSSATLTPLVIDHAGPLGLIGLVGWLMWVAWICTYGITLIRLTPKLQASLVGQ